MTRKLSNGAIVTFLALATFILSACSESKSVAEQTLQKQIELQSNGHIKLISFKKTDGQTFNLMGVSGYRLDFEAVIEFDSSGTWTAGASGLEPFRFDFSPNPPLTSGIAGMLNSATGSQGVQAGERIKITSNLLGSQSDNGWTFVPGTSLVKSEQ